MGEQLLMLGVIVVALTVAGVTVLAMRGRTITMPRGVLGRPLQAMHGWRERHPDRRPPGPSRPEQEGPAPRRPGRGARAERGRPAPPRPAPSPPVEEAAVRRFVIEAPRGGQEQEPRLPAKVVAGSGWHGSFFHGWCGAAGGARPNSHLVVRAAALRGATHASMGTEGQDAIGAAWDEARSALYLAVADGLGSLPRSGRVAIEAITAALHLCVSRPDGIAFAQSGDRLFEAIAAGMLRSLGDRADQLDGACTLVVAEVVPRFDGAQVTVHGVGDSEAWALYDGQWTPIHHERGGADNATRDMPTHARPYTRIFDLSPGSVLLLGSDGFAGALDTSASPLARGLASLWRRRPGWLDFVNHVGFVDDYWADDRSAVAVWIGEGASDG
ncbi:protein phosphatase 2C domain-containing protein [Phytohabitans suffuscus]|uniref:PPM-type phosphatase domain-containing protein n=1 Tax=Phytohabitans suffuscus TaxID=624315 RepID=A0A6F8YFH5_9ACTN|nr:protein phosphatase 2C domain-containing protein [Phytohabitans suffuscus]BCB84728.1 hypothetical protein Psuf_020410 [Phytohabitans suffuscus]